MARVSLCIACFGFGFSVLLYASMKLRWQVAEPLSRYAPRVATAAAAVILLLFVALATAGTSDLLDAIGKGMKEAEFAVRGWFSGLKF